MPKKCIPKGAREMLLEIAKRGPLRVTIEKPALRELKRRKLVECTGVAIECLPNIARRIEMYDWTKHGRAVALQLFASACARNPLGGGLDMIDRALGFIGSAQKRGR